MNLEVSTEPAHGSQEWFRVGRLSDISVQGARVALFPQGRVAIFRAQSGEIFAIEDECPHRQGPLSEGIVHGHSVTCPLHAWRIDLRTGEAEFPDKGCVKSYDVRIDGDFIFVALGSNRVK
jgi:nitrite reductase (NADH) small subunit